MPPIGGALDLKYPQWQKPLAAAILEFDAQHLRAKLREADEAIAGRFKELAFEKDNQEELRLLSDGLFILRRLKKDRLGSPATKCEPPPNTWES